MARDMVQVSIQGLRMDPKGFSPIILLKEERGARGLALGAAPFEASSVIIELEGISPSRPQTHDFFAEFFSSHGFRLESMEIYGQTPNYHLGRLRYRHGLRRFTRDIRPADGIALAVRLAAPILVVESLLSVQDQAWPEDEADLPFQSFYDLGHGEWHPRQMHIN